MWSYDQVGDSCDIHNGGYSISCETVNKLVVPTALKCGVEIKFFGKVTLKLNFKGDLRSWSTSAVAHWSYTISIINGPSGCGPKITTSRTFEISNDSGFMGNYEMVHPRIKDASTLLKEKLEDILIIEETKIDGLRSSFCKVWPLFFSGSYGYTLCNPCFNRCGDLILELECPLDCNGQLTVPDRTDVCLPRKVCHKREERNDVRESSFSTTTTHRDDSPLRTPTSPHRHLNHKVIVDTESVSDGGYSDDRRSSREKVYRSSVTSGKPVKY